MNIACVTTYNEAQTIQSLVRGLTAYGNVDRVVIVDAASIDGTQSLIKDLTIGKSHEVEGTDLVLTESRNVSSILYQHRVAYSPALLHAFKVAMGFDPAAILQIDAGGSHDPADAPRLLAALKDNRLVIGSRFCRGAQYKGSRRRWLSRLYSIVASVRYRRWINDWTSGYRVFSPSLVRALLNHGYKAQMHGFNAEVLKTAFSLGSRVTEVPITYQAGRSSFNWTGAREALEVLA